MSVSTWDTLVKTARDSFKTFMNNELFTAYFSFLVLGVDKYSL